MSMTGCQAAQVLLAALLLSVLAVPPARAQEADAARTQAHEQMLDRLVADEKKLGSDEWRAQKLAQSRRPHELIQLSDGARTLRAFVVYPEAEGPWPVLLMIPEDQGLNNWARDMADQLAAMGAIVLVPDMLSGLAPNGGGRDSFPDLKSVFRASSGLPAHEASMISDLNRWADYAKHLGHNNGKLAVVGFAWGGGRALWFAVQRKDLSACFVFYDAAPPAEALATLGAPVYAFYAEHDPRVTKSLAATQAAMSANAKAYEAIVYPGSDHMFVRLGEEPGNDNPANIEARHQALARLQELLARL